MAAFFLPAAIELDVKSSSDTTIEYSISNKYQSHLSPTARRLQDLVLLLLRFCAFFLSCSLAFAEARVLWYGRGVIEQLLSQAGSWMSSSYQVALHVDYRIQLLVQCLTLYLVFRRGYTLESLLVIRGLGIQTATSSPSYLSTATTRFIPSNHIQDIIINEAFRGFEVKFYLGVVVEDEGEIVVVFPVSRARLAVLLPIADSDRNYSQSEQRLKGSGENQELVCMSRRYEIPCSRRGSSEQEPCQSASLRNRIEDQAGTTTSTVGMGWLFTGSTEITQPCAVQRPAQAGLSEPVLPTASASSSCSAPQWSEAAACPSQGDIHYSMKASRLLQQLAV